MPNLKGAPGSFPLAASLTQSQANIGAKMMTKSAFTDWNQLLGKLQPKIEVLVLRSAHGLSVRPACSKEEANSAYPTNSAPIRMRWLRSTRVQPPERNTHPKNPTDS